ncbi:MAG: c-type cytochrome, partial [Bacteroidia bacterium]|nr:c-type cytochrome [Bacteroidia bacterium]
GKANYGYDVIKQRHVLGRFGWKAAQPTLKQQTAGAYHEDMGVTSSYFPYESAHGQLQDDGLNDDTELTDSLLHAVTFYVQTLAVPARRNADTPTVMEGKNIFMNAGCGSCHRPSMTTAVNVAFPEISNQKIFPYSDMLLHDMGSELADNRGDYRATGNEWRTPPLWGIGLTKLVNGHNNYLHDGRARSLIEAIMWHGGEGAASRNYVKQLSAVDRAKLISFLESL